MGQRSGNGSNGRIPSVASTDLQRTRFGVYFPRAFACAHSLTGDEAQAKEAAVEAFTLSFTIPVELSDEEFGVLLFTTVRDLCRSRAPVHAVDGNLNVRERELLALLFDAQLDRESVRRLMRTTEQALSSALIGALRKLRAGVALAAAEPSFRPA